MSVILQPRDSLVIEGLARAIRVILLTQIAELWGTSISDTRRRMAKLEGAGHVEQKYVFAEPPPDVSEPLARGTPGDAFENAGAISYAAKKRYLNGPPAKRMRAYVASRSTLTRFGLRSVAMKGHQISHEVGLSQCWIQSVWPHCDWVGEDSFPESEKGFRMKVVDVLLCTDGDIRKPYLAVDYLGKYSRDRVVELASFLLERREPPLPFVFY